MQITSLGVQLSAAPDAPVYTWQQTWRFFIIGTLYAVGSAVLPVLWQVGHDYVKHSGNVDWTLLYGTIAATTGPALYLYWREHKALLKIPPFFDIPPEFRPEGRKLVADVHQETSFRDSKPGASADSSRVKVQDTHTELSLEPMTPTEDKPKT